MFDLKNWIKYSMTININVYFWYIWKNFLLPAVWLRKTINIKSWTRLFRMDVYIEVLIAKFIHYHHSHKNRGFLKKKERVKGFFIFMTMPSFRQVESKYCKKKPCERGCGWIIKLSHCLDFGYRCTLEEKKICEVNNSWYFLKMN